MSHTPDTTLVQQSLSGNRQAYAELVSRHQSSVCATAYAIVRDSSLSEDIGQEAFVQGWSKLDQLREPSKVGSWLCSIARNEGLQVLRKQKRSVNVDGSRLASEQNVEELLEKEQTRALVSAVLERVPESCRAALILFYREEQSIREVARALGISEEAAKQRISRGRKEMRAQIEQLVGRELCESRPGENFALGVMGAISSLPASVEQAQRTLDPNPSLDDTASSRTQLTRTRSAAPPTPKSYPLWLKLCAIAVLGAVFVATGVVFFGGGSAFGSFVQLSEPKQTLAMVSTPDQATHGPARLPTTVSGASVVTGTASQDRKNMPTFEGRVLISGTKQPCIHADLSLHLPNTLLLGRKADALTDDSGRFRIEGLEPGTYEMHLGCREPQDADRARLAFQKRTVRLPNPSQDWFIDLPADWSTLTDETIADAPPAIAKRLRSGEFARVRSEEEMLEAAQRHADADGDGKVSEDEQRTHDEMISHSVAPTEGYVSEEDSVTYFHFQEASYPTLTVPTEGHLRQGPADAVVTIVTIVNFGSPICIKGHAILKRLLSDYPDQLSVVTRVQSGVVDSQSADRAYCAARRQGKAQAFLDTVWQEATLGRDFSEANMLRIAELIGLNKTQFSSAMTSRKCSLEIDKDDRELANLDIRATPTWVINGKVLVGLRDIATYRRLIEAELNDAPKK